MAIDVADLNEPASLRPTSRDYLGMLDFAGLNKVTKEEDAQTTFLRLQELSAQIFEVKQQSEDPDDEQDWAVSEETANCANTAAALIIKQVNTTDVPWITPSVSATPNGLIQFSWRSRGYSLSVTVGYDLAEVIVVSKNPSETPVRQVVDADTGAGLVPLTLKCIHNA